MPTVSVPEKTLEHWCSQYLVYRYQSNVALWWPAFGQDVDVGSLTGRPGKAVQLELKTTTVVRPNVHDVLIDTLQLSTYLARPLARQPFYVFPLPTWRPGVLRDAARAAGRDPTQFAFSRSRNWWFARSMYCLTTAEVAAMLGLGGPAALPGRARLVRIDLRQQRTRRVIWTNGLQPSPVPWQELWTRLGSCGEDYWPQSVVLPEGWLAGRAHFAREEVMDLLIEASSIRIAGRWDDEPLSVLEPERDGGFTRGRGGEADAERTVDGVDGPDEHRQVVFLDVRAFSR